ncbi:MAG: uncharacterized protein A8A55_2989 [Amphiamblys sp. WSBS2006]|nr:MAG: uncharacterized protein A8A55_2989 [Amphiamblys sp. WSBS2006]
MDEYRKAIRKNEEGEFGLSALLSQFQAPDSFSLTHDLPTEAVLLTDQTAVTLSNIEISSQLFFMLLEKTRVTVGERFSLFNQADGKDCIKEGVDVEYREEVCLSWPVIKNKIFFMESVARIPENSIWLGIVKSLVLEHHAVNILPKLNLQDSEIE